MKRLILLFLVLFVCIPSFARKGDIHTCKQKLMQRIGFLCSTITRIHGKYENKMSAKKAKDATRREIQKKMRKVCYAYCRGTKVKCSTFSSTIKKWTSCDAFQSALQTRLNRVSFYDSEESDDLFYMLIEGEFNTDADEELVL